MTRLTHKFGNSMGIKLALARQTKGSGIRLAAKGVQSPEALRGNVGFQKYRVELGDTWDMLFMWVGVSCLKL